MIVTFANSQIGSASYLYDSTVLVDVGDFHEEYCDVEAVILTHAHFDHIYGLNKLLYHRPDIKVYTNGAGKEMLLNAKKNLSFYHEMPFTFDGPDQIIVVSDRQDLILTDKTAVRAVFTPGHNPSCITWVFMDAIFTGDSLIPGIKTVTNLPGGNRRQAKESEILIKQLSEGRQIYPGHIV